MSTSTFAILAGPCPRAIPGSAPAWAWALRTSSSAAASTLSCARFSGVGRNRQWSTVCSADSLVFVSSSSGAKSTMYASDHPRSPVPSSGAIVSRRLMPGQAEIARMFEGCGAGGFVGSALSFSSALRFGRESRMRWRWRVKMTVRRARWPSAMMIGWVERGGEVGVDVRKAGNVGSAAA